MSRPLVVCLALLACDPQHRRDVPRPPDPATVQARTELLEGAPQPSERLAEARAVDDFQDRLETAFRDQASRRGHAQVDKPLYRPGETIWLRAWDLGLRDLTPADGPVGAEVVLVDPSGAEAARRFVQAIDGVLATDLELSGDLAGGRYVVTVRRDAEVLAERPVIVQRYEPPRTKKQLDFVREAYGPGEEVTATVTVARGTGEPLAAFELTGVVRLDGAEVARVTATTDADGEALVRFTLPDRIERGSGLLTVLVDDAGVTESITRRVPIVLDRLDVRLHPEGGDLVVGLPSRVYVDAADLLGEPADVAGRVVDDQGREVAPFRSHHDGLGRFELTPQPGRAYALELTTPVRQRVALPEAKAHGCVLRHHDDLEGRLPDIRVSVRCDAPRVVHVQAVLRERLVDRAAVVAGPEVPGVAWLRDGDATRGHAQGVARVTVFDEARVPLAERLVYRAGAGLQVRVTPDRSRYAPRDEVRLDVRTTDAQGRPVPASLGLSVVDDTVLSFADDEAPHLLAAVLLQAELEEPLHEPNWYFDPDEPGRALGLDLVMGAKGWRRFDWEPVLQAAPVAPWSPPFLVGMQRRLEAFGYVDGLVRGPKVEAKGRAVAELAEPLAMAVAPMAPPPKPAEAELDDAEEEAVPADVPVGAAEVRAARRAGERQAAGAVAGLLFGAADEAMDLRQDRQQVAGWAPVRAFPMPRYTEAYDGPRTDFRDTVAWLPDVRTDAQGQATVRFSLSDAVTSFRVTAEGVGDGLAGHTETVIASSLPFSLAAKLPVAVSEGDEIEVPVTLSNEAGARVSVALRSSFGDLLTAVDEPAGVWELAAGQRRTAWTRLAVTGTRGDSEVRLSATGAGLSDELTRTLHVAPRGFPRAWEAAGETSPQTRFTVDLSDALPGTVQASVRLYPSPVATMVEGMEAMLREPGGCFEQTSSSNYPNVMVLRYLQEHDVAEPALVKRAQGMLRRGYDTLTGYEVPQDTGRKGYEWFGGAPAHEALTAYGLVEFVDMTAVHDVDQDMIARTAAWLRSRRDGEGGYQRNARALDSFGQAAPDVTDAYITWALAEARQTEGLDKELARAAQTARDTEDAYILGLVTNTLLVAPGQRAAGLAAVRRLVALQDRDGAWTRADHSITRSGGENLTIETTSLAVLALLEAGGQDAAVRQAVGWLNDHRGGYGQWGSTQATVLALRAMTAYARASRATSAPGALALRVDGEQVWTSTYEAGHTGAITFEDLGTWLTPGVHEVELLHDGEPMPFSLAASWTSLTPSTSPEATVDLTTAVERAEVPLGESVRLTATLRNRRDVGQPMTLARIGLPGGLSAQTWQLEELRTRGVVDFYETGPQEVVLYLRDLAPSEEVVVPLELVAEVAGTFTAPASRAYLYYTDEHKVWVAGEKVVVTR